MRRVPTYYSFFAFAILFAVGLATILFLFLSYNIKNLSPDTLVLFLTEIVVFMAIALVLVGLGTRKR